jgi:hypothetical protein
LSLQGKAFAAMLLQVFSIASISVALLSLEGVGFNRNNLTWRNPLKTIYTSNFDLEGLQSRLDERISSRIQQMCEIIELKGADRRKVLV